MKTELTVRDWAKMKFEALIDELKDTGTAVCKWSLLHKVANRTNWGPNGDLAIQAILDEHDLGEVHYFYNPGYKTVTFCLPDLFEPWGYSVKTDARKKREEDQEVAENP